MGGGKSEQPLRAPKPKLPSNAHMEGGGSPSGNSRGPQGNPRQDSSVGPTTLQLPYRPAPGAASTQTPPTSSAPSSSYDITKHRDYSDPFNASSIRNTVELLREDMYPGHHLRKTIVTPEGTAPGMKCITCLTEHDRVTWTFPHRLCHVCNRNFDQPGRFERPDLYAYSEDTKFRVKKLTVSEAVEAERQARLEAQRANNNNNNNNTSELSLLGIGYGGTIIIIIIILGRELSSYSSSSYYYSSYSYSFFFMFTFPSPLGCGVDSLFSSLVFPP